MLSHCPTVLDLWEIHGGPPALIVLYNPKYYTKLMYIPLNIMKNQICMHNYCTKI